MSNKKSPAEFGVSDSGNENRLRNYVLIGVVVVVIVIGVAAVVLRRPAASGSSGSVELNNVQTFESQGRTHVNVGEIHPQYNSNPPTSGWHYPTWPDYGFYKDSVPDEYLVHNLEHGAIWISYKSKDDTQIINALNTLVSSDPERIIVTYRPENDAPIAVAAWGALLKLDHVDEGQIKAFIQRYRFQGPENVP